MIEAFEIDESLGRKIIAVNLIEGGHTKQFRVGGHGITSIEKCLVAGTAGYMTWFDVIFEGGRIRVNSLHVTSVGLED